MKVRLRKVFSGILIVWSVSSLVLAGVVFAAPQPGPSPQHGPEQGINPETGRVSFIGAGGPIRVTGVTDQNAMDSGDRALAMAAAYGGEFGLKNAAAELERVRSGKDRNGNDVVRFRQIHHGVPVIGSTLIVNMTARGELLSISGEVSSGLMLSTRPAIGSAQARSIAVKKTAEWYGIPSADLVSSAAELSIFDESILMASSRPPELVWRVEVTAARAALPVRELVLANALTGEISFHVDQLDAHVGPGANSLQAAGSRRTYTAAGGGSLPGTFLCDQTRSSCSGGSDPDADDAHRYAADTLSFYSSHHQRNGIDNAGSPVLSTVHYGINYQNAFWNGSQVVFGDDMAADDVVGHEITHGVTEKTSGLIYYGQSGAINESFSDLWGEFIDQTNGSGNDSAAVKWLIAEDSALNAIRSMSNPPLYGQPDRMGSPLYYTGTGDSGGVHINSGVNNKAVYLLVDGGTFNGKTISPIGLNKTAALYYETQAHLLPAGANYSDLYYALLQACQNLIGGAAGMTQANCEQVRQAAEAVEMRPAPPPTPTRTPSPTRTKTSPPPPPAHPLYLSLANGQTIGGVSASDEDILYFDGQTWNLFFDGSDVGAGTPDLVAFSILDSKTILMSFSAAVTLNGIAATPRDVLRFDAASLGGSTTGSFSMYFDGSDAGLDDETNEKIDALSLLPDGRLLLSMTGNPSVPGAADARDEDLLAFLPASLGDATSGSWALYFDGSDVGLSETSGEDIDALDVAGNTIYLSTQDGFSVDGITGMDEDVFVCVATSLGDATACTYSASPYFDGSFWELESNDVDAFQALTAGALPTPVPTSTATRTPTRTSTAGPSATNPATGVPSRTPTVIPASTFSFDAVADARVIQTSPSSNYGSAPNLLVDGDPGAAQTAFLRFSASGIGGSIQSVKLRIFCTTNGTANGPALYRAGNNWTESGTGGITWNNRPALTGPVLGNKDWIGVNSWVEYDVTSVVTGNGTYTFALVGDSTDGLVFSSREGSMSPQLVVTWGLTASTPTSTSVPVASPTRTPTVTPPSTAIISTATRTATSISQPSVSPTATLGASLASFAPVADSYVDASNSAVNYGGSALLRADGSPLIGSYLHFDVQGLNGTVVRATLRMYANSASSQGCAVYSAGTGAWAEAQINYENAPAPGEMLGSSGAFGGGGWVEMDVTAFITGNGAYNLVVTTPASTAVSLASRETGPNAPQLVIETIP